MALETLKTFNTNSASLDAMVELHAEARITLEEYTALGVEAPAWVQPALESLKRAIQTRNADALAAKLRDLQLRRDSLKTTEEKRASIDDEIAKLQAKLNPASASK